MAAAQEGVARSHHTLGDQRCTTGGRPLAIIQVPVQPAGLLSVAAVTVLVAFPTAAIAANPSKLSDR